MPTIDCPPGDLRIVGQREERELAVVVDLREAADHRRRELVQAIEEAEVARLLGQARDEASLDLRVLGTHGPQREHGAVAAA